MTFVSANINIGTTVECRPSIQFGRLGNSD